MTAYRELIERLEKATGPDREIDALLMEFGHTRDKRHIGAYYDDNTPALDDVWVDRATNKWRSTSAFEFTASIDAAVSLVGKMLPGWKWRAEPDFASVFDAGGDWTRYEEAGDCASAPIALCLALLRALEAQSKDKEEGE